MIWIVLPLIAFVFFGLYVRREAERLRSEDGTVVRGRVRDLADRPKVMIKLKLAGNRMATLAELRVRQEIEDAIEERGIGSVADAGSGKGWAHITVVVTDPAVEAEAIRGLLHERGLLTTSLVEVSAEAATGVR